MSNTPEACEDRGLIGTHRWRLVSSGSTIDLIPVRSKLTPLAISIVAVLLAGGMKLAGVTLFWALVAAAVVVAVGLAGLWANRLEETKFRRIRFDGLRRQVEIGEDVRSFDSLNSVGIDRATMSPANAPTKKVQRATLVLRTGTADTAQSLPLIRGHLLNEPRMEAASRLISAKTGVPVVHRRNVDPAGLWGSIVFVMLMCVWLIAATIAEIVLLKTHLDRRRLKERAVFAEGSVLSDEPFRGNGRGPFRTLKIQLEDRTAQLTTRRWEPFGLGEKVTVFYDPSRPNHVEMDDSRHSLPAQAFLPTALLAASVFVCILMTKAIQTIRIAKRP